MTYREALAEGIDAATSLGLDTTRAAAVADVIERRLGFEGETYVFALAGGTGVGKSSLLNAVAASEVAEVRAIRPTTSRPLAWIAAEDATELKPLLDWVGVADIVLHDRDDLSDVAILDLPDVDSVKVEHRATVDGLLPRLDSVYWVVDSEKYDDERLHSYLRGFARHGERMVFLFNKAERHTPTEQQLLASDLERRLTLDGIKNPKVAMVSARSGQGVSELRQTLTRAASQKQAMAEKLGADAREAVNELAIAAGANGQQLVNTDQRNRAVEAAVKGALAVVDPTGLSRQIEGAVLTSAQRRGGSLLARLLAAMTSITGTKRRHADPEGFLLNWRQRGSLGHLVNPLRQMAVEALVSLPATARPGAMAALGFDHLEDRLVKAIDQSTRASRADVVPRPSWFWSLIGVIQLVLGAGFVFGLAWYLLLIFGPGNLASASVDLPYLGPVPTPLALLGSTLVASLVLGLMLSLQARWKGRRQGRKVAQNVAVAVRSAISATALEPLRQIDDARERLYRASIRM